MQRVQASPLAVPITLACILALVAGLLRFVNLTGLPAGLHGDEGIVGLEARRVLEEGWIGLYSPFAAGQPAGPLYAWAPFVQLFDNSIFAVRLFPAMAGTATVVLTFLLLRRDLGNAGAFGAALLLAGMVWHIHYSRIAFPLIVWPIVVLLAMWLLVRAFETGDRKWWAFAGIAAGAGVYVYNAHWLFGGAVALAGLVYLAAEGWHTPARTARNVTFAAVWAFVVLVPVLRLVFDDDSVYTSHFERDSLTNSDRWAAHEGLLSKAGLIGERYYDVWQLLRGGGRPDAVDAGGAIALVSLPLVLLASWGIAVGWSRQSWLWWWVVSLAVLLVMPFASVFTIGGVPRRPFAMAIAFVVLAGIAVAHLRILVAPMLTTTRRQVTAFGAIAAIAVAISAPGIVAYFTTFADHNSQRWVFPERFTQAAEFMDDIPPDVDILLRSNRHSIDYETRQFLAPAIDGANWDGEAASLRQAVGERAVVVVVVDAGREHAETILATGGEPIVSDRDPGARFSAFCIGCSPDQLDGLRAIDLP